MIVRNQYEALCVAMEMESRAIHTYERALQVASDAEVRQGISDILRDEQEHLRKFAEMRDSCPDQGTEERLLIQAMAAQTLFSGGVMEMKRENGLDSMQGLYTFAADSEHDAVSTYLDFADKCEDKKIAQAFRAIAQEEAGHLENLNARLDSIRGEEK